MIKQTRCRTCQAPLFEALLESGEKVMMDWEPDNRPVSIAGTYFLVKGETEMPTVRRFTILEIWPTDTDQRWSNHAETCKGHHR